MFCHCCGNELFYANTYTVYKNNRYCNECFNRDHYTDPNYNRTLHRANSKLQSIENKPFWMIYVEGKQSPNNKHFSEISAKVEASRLSKLNPNINVYVLKVIGSMSVLQPTWNTYP